jgi:alpha-tubulin suppressor-like RCC1 family protein
MRHSSRVTARASLPVLAITGTVIAAIVMTAAGASAHPGPQARRDATDKVLHWGSLFGGKKGNYDIRTSPVAVTLPGRVAQVGSSNSTEYALLTDGRLYAWGLGTQGQLGNGRVQNSFRKPVRVHFPAGVRIASIPADAMPYDTGLAVDTTGRAWGWGHNAGGELCLGSKKQFRTPVRLPLRDVTALAGASHHVIYDAHGTLFACGQNVKGDLGTGSSRSTTRPARVARLHGRQVTRLVASFANSGALLSDGRYFDWGYDGAGQLGDRGGLRSSNVPVQVRLPAPVVKVAQGGSLWNNGQTLVLLSNGTLWSWGDNHASQLGNGATSMARSPVRFHAPAGVMYRDLATGSATSYAVSAGGKVYAWGVSHVGQVGNGHTRTIKKPVVVATGAGSISSTANNVVITVVRNSGS